MRLSRLGLLAVLLAAYLASMYYIGVLVGSGYSVDVVEKPLPQPEKLSFDDYAFSMFHVSMRIWGLAYEKVYVDATAEPLILHGYHFTEGLVCERVQGAEDIYECRGSGYIYKPVGFVEEYVSGGGETINYYSGWIIVLLYSIHQAVFAAAVLAPVAAGLYSYGLARLGLRGKAYLAVSAAGIAALVAGGLEGLAMIPSHVPGLYPPLAVSTASAVVAAFAAQVLAYRWTLRRSSGRSTSQTS
ncbi:hypothetical protein [Hyperthermus butylicus]|uniref:Uncharacterized protein n=1 Tax=Hyperthermus butylicus (strain DSM 5456 / JCM 9403 / PLM1-5) TaxID=415426 RepID=A2BKH7_HYPBU|nr:hypothetical protein [Hyperthermus butylicus]ABM80488.1 hypothetical protein Hbut_0631 [Hyperthermus butylicus DSM 5456]